jgi:predicted ribosomally synthesized peptide with nif11-like leader
MSAKNIDAFVEKVSQDKTLQAQLTALHKKILRDTKETSAAGIVKIAAAKGFQFTAKDWNQERKERAKRASKTELAGVTGQEWVSCEGCCYTECSANYICGAAAWY